MFDLKLKVDHSDLSLWSTICSLWSLLGKLTWLFLIMTQYDPMFHIKIAMSQWSVFNDSVILPSVL